MAICYTIPPHPSRSEMRRPPPRKLLSIRHLEREVCEWATIVRVESDVGHLPIADPVEADVLGSLGIDQLVQRTLVSLDHPLALHAVCEARLVVSSTGPLAFLGAREVALAALLRRSLEDARNSEPAAILLARLMRA